MKLPELPTLLTSVILIVAGWIGGYIHAQASSSAPPPPGPYRSMTSDSLSGNNANQTKNAPTAVPPESNPNQTFNYPYNPGYAPAPSYPSMQERQQQWQAYQQQVQQREEEGYKRWLAQQEEMHKRFAEREKQRQQEFEQREKQFANNQPLPPPYWSNSDPEQQRKQWQQQRSEWEKQSKEFARQQEKALKAWRKENEKRRKEQEEYMKKHAPPAANWNQSPRDFPNAPPRWNEETWKQRQAEMEKHRQEFEKRRQEYLSQRPQFDYPRNGEGYGGPGPWPVPPRQAPHPNYRPYGPYSQAPQYRQPAPGYYMSPWSTPVYPYGPRW